MRCKTRGQLRFLTPEACQKKWELFNKGKMFEMKELVKPAAKAGAVSLRRGDSWGAELGGGADRKNHDLGKTMLLNFSTSSIWRQALSQSRLVHLCYLNMKPTVICLKSFILGRVKCFMCVFITFFLPLHFNFLFPGLNSIHRRSLSAHIFNIFKP